MLPLLVVPDLWGDSGSVGLVAALRGEPYAQMMLTLESTGDLLLARLMRQTYRRPAEARGIDGRGGLAAGTSTLSSLQ